jgi:hypothetical protein
VVARRAGVEAVRMALYGRLRAPETVSVAAIWPSAPRSRPARRAWWSSTDARALTHTLPHPAKPVKFTDLGATWEPVPRLW